MEVEEIITKIQQALEKCSLDSGIDKRNIRVKLTINEGFIADGIKCSLMYKTNFVYDIDLKGLLGLNMLQAPIVSKYLCDTLKNLAKDVGIETKDINARIYTTQEDFYPSVYLYNGGKAVREITVAELTGN